MENVGSAKPDTQKTKDNTLTQWVRQHSHDYEKEAADRACALELAIQCINDGTLTLLDGPNSPLSRQIKLYHGLDTFEMNGNWIGTAQDWRCPCCNRSKFEISRVGNKKQILAKLVEHHDHMSEALKDAFHQVFVNTKISQHTSTGLALVERMATAFAAYDRVLVCEDCNNADTRAKTLLSQYDKANLKHQSFSISQIRLFIRIHSHAPHQIDEKNLKDIWTTVRPAYIARMRLIFEVAKAAATQDHWYEKYPPGLIPVPTLENRNIPDFKWLSSETLHRALKKEMISHYSDWSRWRTEQKKTRLTPPENYEAIILSQGGSARMWRELDHSWHCPICERQKHQTVKYENGRVGFQTHAPTYRSILWRDISRICMDCCAVVKSMAWELKKGFGVAINCTFDCITPNQLRSIITARPYSPPLIDPLKAKTLIDIYIQNKS
ncbi:hypothetical protein GCM10011450_09430 [Advenella faeciporci]|uniref:Uncharacterized protein n=1 Tax=Advenella faeciporci TaxID=797535 RepID=A0A918JIX0_9BURK|nr:hypothetical protein [Advenella faeciporci]GGW81639.1 hypothetical protein GCM10011450_09430 [Advenella faeciporci]